MTITPPLTRVRLVGATTTAAPTHQARSKAAVLALRALVFAGAVGTGAAAVAATQTLFASESGGNPAVTLWSPAVRETGQAPNPTVALVALPELTSPAVSATIAAVAAAVPSLATLPSLTTLRNSTTVPAAVPPGALPPIAGAANAAPVTSPPAPGTTAVAFDSASRSRGSTLPVTAPEPATTAAPRVSPPTTASTNSGSGSSGSGSSGSGSSGSGSSGSGSSGSGSSGSGSPVVQAPSTTIGSSGSGSSGSGSSGSGSSGSGSSGSGASGKGKG